MIVNSYFNSLVILNIKNHSNYFNLWSDNITYYRQKKKVFEKKKIVLTVGDYLINKKCKQNR